MLGQSGRSYLLHLPPDYDGNNAEDLWPLMIVLHGGRVNAEAMQSLCQMNALADQERFIVVYPNGTGPAGDSLTWNAGKCCGPAQENQVDDVGFLDTLLEKLQRWSPYNSRRVYLCGISNGGMMALRFAAEKPERVAAVASVSGPLEIDLAPPKPVPLLYFHGTADPFIPFDGGTGEHSIAPVDFRSVESTLELWKQANRCQSEGQLQEVASATSDDETSVSHCVFPSEAGGAIVEQYIIHNGGHTWPGKAPRGSAPVGLSTTHINATQVIWEFCRRFPIG